MTRPIGNAELKTLRRFRLSRQCERWP